MPVRWLGQLVCNLRVESQGKKKTHSTLLFVVSVEQLKATGLSPLAYDSWTVKDIEFLKLENS